MMKAREGNKKMYPGDEATGQTRRSSSHDVRTDYNPNDLRDLARESSKDTSEGDVHDILGELDSDAEKEVAQQIISVSQRKRTKREIVPAVQALQRGEDVPASVGEADTEVENNIPTSSPSVLSGLSSECLSKAQIQFEIYGGGSRNLENMKIQQEIYSSNQDLDATSLNLG